MELYIAKIFNHARTARNEHVAADVELDLWHDFHDPRLRVCRLEFPVEQPIHPAHWHTEHLTLYPRPYGCSELCKFSKELETRRYL